MGAIRKLFYALTKKDASHNTDSRLHYVFYKIVDYTDKDEYKLQCINTNAIFTSSLESIVFDVDILFGLHPIQSCYVGIEYAKSFRKTRDQSKIYENKIEETPQQHPICRYGRYQIRTQNRNGSLLIFDKESNEEFVAEPSEIAFSEKLIQDFDAAQAFHIGLLTGLKLHDSVFKKKETLPKKPHLTLVK